MPAKPEADVVMADSAKDEPDKPEDLGTASATQAGNAEQPTFPSPALPDTEEGLIALIASMKAIQKEVREQKAKAAASAAPHADTEARSPTVTHTEIAETSPVSESASAPLTPLGTYGYKADEVLRQLQEQYPAGTLVCVTDQDHLKGLRSGLRTTNKIIVEHGPSYYVDIEFKGMATSRKVPVSVVQLIRSYEEHLNMIEYFRPLWERTAGAG